MTEREFVASRQARDRTLLMPKLILHALQVNIAGGKLPEPEANGRRYLKCPLDALSGGLGVMAMTPRLPVAYRNNALRRLVWKVEYKRG